MALYFANSLYLAENIKVALKEVFGTNKSILNYLYITSIGTRISLPIATIYKPSYYIFTNYNGVGS